MNLIFVIIKKKWYIIFIKNNHTFDANQELSGNQKSKCRWYWDMPGVQDSAKWSNPTYEIFSPRFLFWCPKTFLRYHRHLPIPQEWPYVHRRILELAVAQVPPLRSGPQVLETQIFDVLGRNGGLMWSNRHFWNGNESRVNSAHFGVPMAKIDNGVNFWEQFEFSRFLAFLLDFSVLGTEK